MVYQMIRRSQPKTFMTSQKKCWYAQQHSGKFIPKRDVDSTFALNPESSFGNAFVGLVSQDGRDVTLDHGHVPSKSAFVTRLTWMRGTENEVK